MPTDAPVIYLPRGDPLLFEDLLAVQHLIRRQHQEHVNCSHHPFIKAALGIPVLLPKRFGRCNTIFGQ